MSVCWHPAVSELFCSNHLAHRLTHQKDTGAVSYLPAPCRCLRYPRASNMVLNTQVSNYIKPKRMWPRVVCLQTGFGLSVTEDHHFTPPEDSRQINGADGRHYTELGGTHLKRHELLNTISSKNRLPGSKEKNKKRV